MNKEYTRSDILKLIENNNSMVIKSLLKLYEYQTEEEKGLMTTSEHNGLGFNFFDAPILTNISEFYINHGFLTSKQLLVVRKKIKKYVGQLMRIANEKLEVRI